MRYSLCLIFLWVAAALPFAALAQTMPYAQLQILDKVTTQKKIINLPVGKTAIYGNLRLLPRRCDNYDIEAKAESAVFIEIYDSKKPELKKPIFTGWLFKSSPSLSALEHAIYDVVLLGCNSNLSQSKSAAPE
jgi:hypothetical protein